MESQRPEGGPFGSGFPAVALTSLPYPFVLEVLAQLTPMERARCALVSREWRALVATRSLWTRLDLTRDFGRHPSAAALRGAAARAGGQLLSLALCGRGPYEALPEVLAANRDTLRELWVELDDKVVDKLAAYCAAAPQLRLLEADIEIEAVKVPDLLRNDAAWSSALRIGSMSLEAALLVDVQHAAAAIAQSRVPITRLSIMTYTFDHALPSLDAVLSDTLLDAVLQRRIQCLDFWAEWDATAACVPALIRLLRGNVLQDLRLTCSEWDNQLLGHGLHAATMLGAALRENTALTRLSLVGVGLWRNSRRAGVLLLKALTGHPTLRYLDLSNNYTHPAHDDTDDTLAYAAVAGLVAANAPALKELDLGSEYAWCCQTEAALGMLCDALPLNTHLEALAFCHEDLRAEFARERLLPALRANQGLHTIVIGGVGDHIIDSELYIKKAVGKVKLLGCVTSLITLLTDPQTLAGGV